MPSVRQRAASEAESSPPVAWTRAATFSRSAFNAIKPLASLWL